MKKIAVIMAMQGEANPIIDGLSLRAAQSNPRLPIRLYSGQTAYREIILATSGKDTRTGADLIHSQPATLTTHYVIERFDPDFIISAGTAGGVSKHGAQIGDVYLSLGSVRFHDRRCPIPGLHDYGVGGYPSWGTAPAEALAKAGFKRGGVSSGDSLYMSREEQAQFDANEATVKDMEAAAVAWVASLYDKPFMALKAITDLIDCGHMIEEQFVANFSIATRNLESGLCKFLTLI